MVQKLEGGKNKLFLGRQVAGLSIKNLLLK